jgi:hypothetical protein
LSVRNLARLGAAAKTNIAEVARVALRNRPSKPVLDYFFERLDCVQKFIRTMIAMVTQNAHAAVKMPIDHFERVAERVYASSYRGDFELQECNRSHRELRLQMTTMMKNPNGGLGFIKFTFFMTIKDTYDTNEPYSLFCYVATPSFGVNMYLTGKDVEFRAMRPVLNRSNIHQEPPRAWIYVDADLCPGCEIHHPIFDERHVQTQARKSDLGAAHLVTRYSILGETRWCRAQLTTEQTFESIEAVCMEKNFVTTRVLLEAIGILLNEKVAIAIKDALVTTMMTARRDACRLIRSGMAHAVFDRYPLIRRLLFARNLGGRRGILSNSEIATLNGPTYAAMTKHRLSKMQK